MRCRARLCGVVGLMALLLALASARPTFGQVGPGSAGEAKPPDTPTATETPAESEGEPTAGAGEAEPAAEQLPVEEAAKGPPTGAKETTAEEGAEEPEAPVGEKPTEAGTGEVPAEAAVATPRAFAGDLAKVASEMRAGVRPEALLDRLTQLSQDATVDLYDIKSHLNAAEIALQEAVSDQARLRQIQARDPQAVAAGGWTEKRAREEVSDLRAMFAHYRDLFQTANDRAYWAEGVVARCQADVGQAERTYRSLELAGATERLAEADQLVRTLRQRLEEARQLRQRWLQVKDVAQRDFRLASDVAREIVQAIPLGQQRSLWRRSDQRITLSTFPKTGAELQRLALWLTDAGARLPKQLRSWAEGLRQSPPLAKFLARVVGLLVVLGLAWWFIPRLRAYVGERLRPPLGHEEATKHEWRAQSAETLASAVVVLLAAAAALEIAHVPQDWFLLLYVLAAAWAGYAIVENAAELFFAPQDPGRRWLPCRDEQAVHLYAVTRLLALVSAMVVPILSAFSIFDYGEADVMALPTLLYRTVFLALLLYLIAGQGGLQALVPKAETPRNRALRRAAQAAPAVLGAVAVVWVVAYAGGYTNLADAVRRAMLVAVLAVSGAWAAHRMFVRRLGAYLARAEEPDYGLTIPAVLRRSRAIIGVVEVIVLALLAGWAVAAAARVPGRHWQELQDLLTSPVAEVKGATISILGVLKGLLLIVAAALIGRLTRELLRRSGRLHARMDPGVQYAIATFAHYGILGLGIVFAAPAIGFDWSVLAVFAGAAGIGLGFGLQDIARNFVSGLILLVEQPFRVGERVEIGGVTGTITDINIRTTTLQTPQNTYVIVPNGSVMSGNIHNWATKDTKVRLDIEVGVAYGTDLPLAKELMLEVARSHPRTLDEPAPDVWLLSFGDSAINLRLMAWLPEPVGVYATQSDIYMAVWDAFVEHGIEIPFPQQDIHIRSDVALQARRDETGVDKQGE